MQTTLVRRAVVVIEMLVFTIFYKDHKCTLFIPKFCITFVLDLSCMERLQYPGAIGNNGYAKFGGETR